jgi:hypothetical protein
MPNINLLLNLPAGGSLTAASLSVEEFARHRSPGPGKYYQGRSIIVSVAMKNEQPDFRFLEEGGWRNAAQDTQAAIRDALQGKRTKTALSNSAFNAIPISAYREIFLCKTGGQILRLDPGDSVDFKESPCHDRMTPNEIAAIIGQPLSENRKPRLYMIIAPTDFLVLTNLTPAEYAWYATHRPGKIFRNVMFAELDETRVTEQYRLVAEEIYKNARQELLDNSTKKTKTLVMAECLNRVPFHTWIGYGREAAGGLYVGNREFIKLWRFPAKIPQSWEREY